MVRFIMNGVVQSCFLVLLGSALLSVPSFPNPIAHIEPEAGIYLYLFPVIDTLRSQKADSPCIDLNFNSLIKIVLQPQVMIISWVAMNVSPLVLMDDFVDFNQIRMFSIVDSFAHQILIISWVTMNVCPLILMDDFVTFTQIRIFSIVDSLVQNSLDVGSSVHISLCIFIENSVLSIGYLLFPPFIIEPFHPYSSLILHILHITH